MCVIAHSFNPTTLLTDEVLSSGSPRWPYLDNQEDVRRGVCDGEDGRTGEGGDSNVGVMGAEHVLHLV